MNSFDKGLFKSIHEKNQCFVQRVETIEVLYKFFIYLKKLIYKQNELPTFIYESFNNNINDKTIHQEDIINTIYRCLRQANPQLFIEIENKKSLFINNENITDEIIIKNIEKILNEDWEKIKDENINEHINEILN